MSRDPFNERKEAWLNQVAEDPELPPLAFKLAFRLAWHFNRKRGGMRAWPGVPLLARQIGASERAVQKLRGQLVERGHLAVEFQGGDKRSNSYRPILKKVNARSPAEAPDGEPGFTPNDGSPRTTVRQTVNGGSPQGRTDVHPNLLNEPTEEPPDCEEARKKAFFDRFWRVFPKRPEHVDEEEPKRFFLKALDVASPEEILAGAERYAGARAGQDARFTMHPARWLREQRWLKGREPVTPRRSSSVDRPDWVEGLAAFVNGERLQ